LTASLFKKGLSENSSNEIVGVITNLFKKGLTEKPSNKVVGMINRLNGCGSTIAVQEYGCLRGGI